MDISSVSPSEHINISCRLRFFAQGCAIHAIERVMPRRQEQFAPRPPTNSMRPFCRSTCPWRASCDSRAHVGVHCLQEHAREDILEFEKPAPQVLRCGGSAHAASTCHNTPGQVPAWRNTLCLVGGALARDETPETARTTEAVIQKLTAPLRSGMFVNLPVIISEEFDPLHEMYFYLYFEISKKFIINFLQGREDR